MTATSRFVIWGAMPLGAALGGALTGLVGAPAYLALASAGMAAAALVTRCSPVWRTRDFPSQEDLAEPAEVEAAVPGGR